mmetsp:Transcript_14748/g.30002  ORF Transcript_14748/g.30002 Transcript_14748/m.30002 type:complete len:140 (+) Transcript_14748:962-1381(+)
MMNQGGAEDDRVQLAKSFLTGPFHRLFRDRLPGTVRYFVQEIYDVDFFASSSPDVGEIPFQGGENEPGQSTQSSQKYPEQRQEVKHVRPLSAEARPERFRRKCSVPGRALPLTSSTKATSQSRKRPNRSISSFHVSSVG